MALHEMQVGVRELKIHLSQYLQQVKAGKTLVITERGKLIGRIIPVEESLEARLEARLFAMREAGLLAWSGKKLQAIEPIAPTSGKKTVADLLLEDRE